MATQISSGPVLGHSQYWVTSTNPTMPTHARAAPCTAVGAARTTNSNGTNPTHASHHHDKAGKARAGGAPAINAAA